MNFLSFGEMVFASILVLTAVLLPCFRTRKMKLVLLFERLERLTAKKNKLDERIRPFERCVRLGHIRQYHKLTDERVVLVRRIDRVTKKLGKISSRLVESTPQQDAEDSKAETSVSV